VVRPAGLAEADGLEVETGDVAREGEGEVGDVGHEAHATPRLPHARSLEISGSAPTRRPERSRPRGARGRAGDEGHRVVEGDVALEEGLIERPEGAQEVAPARHVERDAPLVEVDEEAAEAVVDGVDVVEEPEDVGLAPGQVLATDPEKDGAHFEVAVDLEEAISIARHVAQAISLLAEDRLSGILDVSGKGRALPQDLLDLLARLAVLAEGLRA